MVANIVSKITVKNVYGKIDIEKLLKEKNKQIELMDVFGLVRKSVPGSSDYGDYVKFRGSFKAVNLETGESVQSGALILPRIGEEVLQGAMSDDVNEVQFGFRIVAKYDADAVTKYTFQIIPLMNPAENDPLVLLESKIAEDFKKLAAPKADKKAA